MHSNFCMKYIPKKNLLCKLDKAKKKTFVKSNFGEPLEVCLKILIFCENLEIFSNNKKTGSFLYDSILFELLRLHCLSLYRRLCDVKWRRVCFNCSKQQTHLSHFYVSLHDILCCNLFSSMYLIVDSSTPF